MKVKFRKMNGAGNDFVLIDDREDRIRVEASIVRRLCDRRRGVGADGVIIIRRAEQADFRMCYYNSDGGEAQMCGNGARCAGHYAAALGLGRNDSGRRRLSLLAQAGRLAAVVDGDRVSISMTNATSFHKNISLTVANSPEIVHFVDTGVPHAVVIETDVAGIPDDDFVRRGRAIRTHPQFAPEGANADFLSVDSLGLATIRTYERGVETETLACGTGAVAGAIVLAQLGLSRSPVRLVTRGGEELAVSFVLEPSGAHDVVLDGPAAVNFDGHVELPRGVEW